MQPGQIEETLAQAGITFPLEGVAPCGTPFSFAHAWEFPQEDTRCSCSSSYECWIVKWTEM